MADSDIEWTDKVWNPVRGCVKVSPGCAHCYAETFAERFRGVSGHAYEQGFDLRLVPEKLTEPLSWKKPRRVFVNSMSDLFQDGVSDDYIDRVFAVMALTPQHTYQVLTKRAERMRAYLSIDEDTLLERWASATMEQELPLDEMARDAVRSGAERDEQETFSAERHWSDVRNGDFPLKNVWLGVSVENQHFADERIPLLLQTPAAVRFISAEPLLEKIRIWPWEVSLDQYARTRIAKLDWVIVGGESGPGARPFDVSWARSIVAQCRDAGVACFVKQLGSEARDAAAERDDMCARETWPAFWLPTINGRRVWRPDLVDKKGGDPDEWPADLRVREFPQ